jgi:hypothetical protein
VELAMGSPKRRNHKTQDLNPSPVAQNKLCKEMGKELKRLPSPERPLPLSQLPEA